MTEEQNAVEIFDNDYNCAQSTYLACRDKSFLDEETAAYVSATFGGGVSLGQTCGALCGAIMALTERFAPPDLKDKDQRTRVGIMKRTFGKWFEDQFGSCMCSDLRSVVPMGESSHPLCTNFVAGCARKISEIKELCELRRIEKGSSEHEKALELRKSALVLPSSGLDHKQQEVGEADVHLGLFSLGYFIATLSLKPIDAENIQLSPLFLDKDYHKTGTDRLLVCFAEKTAYELGYRIIHADAGACKYTQDLYKTLGYIPAEKAGVENSSYLTKVLNA